jgi:hypothetical protein
MKPAGPRNLLNCLTRVNIKKILISRGGVTRTHSFTPCAGCPDDGKGGLCRSWASPCGTCGGRSFDGEGFFRRTSVFPSLYFHIHDLFIRNSAVSIVIMPWAGRFRIRIPPDWKKLYFSAKLPYRFCGPATYPFSGYRGFPSRRYSGRGVRLRNYFNRMSGLRKSGALPIVQLYAFVKCVGTALPQR